MNDVKSRLREIVVLTRHRTLDTSTLLQLIRAEAEEALQIIVSGEQHDDVTRSDVSLRHV